MTDTDRTDAALPSTIPPAPLIPREALPGVEDPVLLAFSARMGAAVENALVRFADQMSQVNAERDRDWKKYIAERDELMIAAFRELIDTSTAQYQRFADDIREIRSDEETKSQRYERLRKRVVRIETHLELPPFEDE